MPQRARSLRLQILICAWCSKGFAGCRAWRQGVCPWLSPHRLPEQPEIAVTASFRPHPQPASAAFGSLPQQAHAHSPWCSLHLQSASSPIPARVTAPRQAAAARACHEGACAPPPRPPAASHLSAGRSAAPPSRVSGLVPLGWCQPVQQQSTSSGPDVHMSAAACALVFQHTCSCSAQAADDISPHLPSLHAAGCGYIRSLCNLPKPRTAKSQSPAGPTRSRRSIRQLSTTRRLIHSKQHPAGSKHHPHTAPELGWRGGHLCAGAAHLRLCAGSGAAGWC